MKVNNLFLVGVAALSLGMTACNNEDVPQVQTIRAREQHLQECIFPL